MAETTGISWTEKTWNPWRGCTKVSPGCKNCYMFSEQKFYGKDPAVVVRTKTWGDPKKWQKQAAQAGKTELVFTCSWSDWFHVDADPWRAEAWALVKQCPNLIFQILTKRHERIKDHLPPDWGEGYPNVWLGVSVENQQCADERIPSLLKVPAKVRFLSCEPLLGPLHLDDPIIDRPSYFYSYENVDGPRDIHWVIIGGESNNRGRTEARPFDLSWARSLIRQCKEAGVACFFKQAGSEPQESDGDLLRLRDKKGGDLAELPEDLRVREFPR